MSKHLIFCLHGMGEQGADWADRGVEVLRNAWDDYGYLAEVPIDAAVEFVPLVYSNFFTDTRARANADFAAFKGALLGSISAAESVGRETLECQLDTYANYLGAGEDHFVWTHVLDVVLYRFSTTLRMGVDTEIAKQIVGALHNTDHRGWSILAHSLGTSVAHNVLASLYNTGFPDAPGGGLAALSPQSTRCQTLAMIANVSRVLQRDDSKVYESNVCPGVANGKRLCAYYLNVRHKYDPLTAVKPFDPDQWPDPGSYAQNRYQSIRPAHIHFEEPELPRVHDFDHYLLNPRVHVPLFRSIRGARLISDSEYLEACIRFDAEPVSETLDRTRSKLQQRQPAPTGNWRQLLSAIRRLHS